MNRPWFLISATSLGVIALATMLALAVTQSQTTAQSTLGAQPWPLAADFDAAGDVERRCRAGADPAGVESFWPDSTFVVARDRVTAPAMPAFETELPPARQFSEILCAAGLGPLRPPAAGELEIRVLRLHPEEIGKKAEFYSIIAYRAGRSARTINIMTLNGREALELTRRQSVEVTRDEADSIRQALTDNSFWTLTSGALAGTDGHIVLVEVAEAQRYRVVAGHSGDALSRIASALQRASGTLAM